MKKIIIPSIVAVLSLILLVSAMNATFVVGKFVNNYFPCEQNPSNSFPCFGIYDVIVMSILVLVIAISLIKIVFEFYKMKRK